jgi:hypothetical protein
MNIEPCSVCFAENYTQNDHFFCSHPLCTTCFIQLKTPHCPICRTTKTIPILVISINNYRNRYIQINHLTKFCLYDHDYKTKLNAFLRNRIKKDFIKKVNKYCPFNRFIIKKKEYLSISDLTNEELINYVLDTKSKSDKDKNIIYNEMFYRQSSSTVNQFS